MMLRRLPLASLIVAVIGTAVVLPAIARAQPPPPPPPGSALLPLFSGPILGGASGAGAVSAVIGRAVGSAPETGRPTYIEQVGSLLLKVIYWLISIAMWFAGLALDLAGKFLNVILGIDYYARLSIVRDGWKLVRDLLNFVFIFVLLAIAFSEIAGLETFQARRALPKLLIAALLVNFSLGIGGAINGVATCVMNTAITSLGIPRLRPGPPPPAPPPPPPGGPPAPQSICGGHERMGSALVAAIANSASIGKYYSFEPSELAAAVGFESYTFGTRPIIDVANVHFDQNLAAFIGAVSATIFVFLLLAALAALVVLFFLRTVIILILLVLSPVPYALGIVPGVAGYARQWWEQFVKYVLFGPVVMVLLALIIKLLSDASGGATLLSELGTSTASFGGGLKSQAFAQAAFFTTFVSAWILMTLFAGLKLGVMGAGMATGFGTRLARGVAGLPLIPARAGGRAVWSRTGAPVAEGLKRARDERAKERLQGPLGRLGMAAGTAFAPRARERLQRRMEDERVKDLKTRGVPLGELNLGNVAHARYAAQERLYEGADEGQIEQMLRTLSAAGRTGTGEFGNARTEFLKRLPHTGVEKLNKMGVIASADVKSEQEKAVEKLGGLDYVKALRKEQKVGVELLKTYNITGDHARAVFEHGNDDEVLDLAVERFGPQWTRGAEYEYGRRTPGVGGGAGGGAGAGGGPGRSGPGSGSTSPPAGLPPSGPPPPVSGGTP